MLLTEARENLLLGLMVHLKLNCRILFKKSVDAGNNFFLVTLLASLNSH